MPHWKTSRFVLDLQQPQVMGIVNLTPDSFSDGGACTDPRAALAHAESLLRAGATVLDLGAESTRPGATPVPLAQELARLLPVVQEVVRWGVPVSIDTYKPEVMRACLALGVDIINDVWALRRRAADGTFDGLDVLRQYPGAGVCLMHMHLEPQTMQAAPMVGEVVPQVLAFLQERTQAVLAVGVDPAAVVWDAGTGFGKTPQQNLSLLAQQARLLAAGYPLLAGWSRKSTLGQLTGQSDPAQRVAASVAAALLAVEHGARVVRVHDVQATVDALKVWQAVAALR